MSRPTSDEGGDDRRSTGVGGIMSDLTSPAEQRPSKQEWLKAIPTPRAIVDHLDKSVIGQDPAKRKLAIAISSHYIRLLDALDRDAPDPVIADPGLRDVVI